MPTNTSMLRRVLQRFALQRLALQRLVPILAGGLALCGCQSASSPPDPPSLVRIRLVDLTVGPTKADGTAWDGGGALIPVGDLAGVAEALGAPDAAVAVAEALAAPALEGLDRPDVVGQATLRSSNGQLQARKFKGTSDSLRPNLNPAPSWENVPFDSQLRLEVTVSDDDLLGTEPIGTFIVNAEALREAARKNEVYQLRLAEQTSNTLLFVGLIVNSLE